MPATTITDLPSELLLLVFDIFDRDNPECGTSRPLFAVSATCRQWRTLLVPRLFQRVLCSNSKHRSMMVEGTRRYGHLARRCTILYDPEVVDDEEASAATAAAAVVAAARPGDPPRLIPRRVRQLLRGMYLPNIDSLELDFVYDIASLAVFGGGSEEYYEDEGADFFYFPPCIENDFKPPSWQNAMDELWPAIARNQRVRHLALTNLPPVFSSSFFRKDWQVFAGQLETLTLRIPKIRPDNVRPLEDENLYTNPAWGSLVENASEAIFSHAQNLRTLDLAFEPGDRYAVGDSTTYDYLTTPLSLQPENMPVLTCLRLNNIRLGRDLIEFMIAHSQTLQSVHLDIWAYTDSFHGAPLRFSTFFKALREVSPVMADFRCEPMNERAMQRIQPNLALYKDPWRSLFQSFIASPNDYAYFVYKDIDWFADEYVYDIVMMDNAFMQGYDMSEYMELQESLQRNRTLLKESGYPGF